MGSGGPNPFNPGRILLPDPAAVTEATATVRAELDRRARKLADRLELDRLENGEAIITGKPRRLP